MMDTTPHPAAAPASQDDPVGTDTPDAPMECECTAHELGTLDRRAELISPALGPDPALYAGQTAKPEALPFEEALATFKNWCRANSLNVLNYGTACGAIEMRPLGTARFDMERFGITGAPTPRQANVFVISGYLSIKTLKRAIRSWEQMQSPKWVVALGSCTLNGGMYWDSYNTVKRLELYLPVDLHIAGCMPRPEALLAGFQKLMDKIKAGEAQGWQDYTRRLDWYRANQKKVIQDWDLPDYNW